MMLSIGSQCVNKKSQDLEYRKKRLFPTHFTWQWSMNMIMMLWCRFQQWSGTFTMLLFEESSETGLFRHLSDHVFGFRNFGNTKSMRVIFLFKILKIYVWLRKCTKNWEKVFCFWDKLILIGIVKLSLLRRGSFSSTGNMLTSRPKIWDVSKRDFFELNWVGSNHWIG